MAKKNFIGINFGNFCVIVENAVETMGHDDSLSYNANFKVVLDGKEELVSGNAWNSGWGGDSEYSFKDPYDKKLRENFDFVDDVLKKTIVTKWKDITLKWGLMNVIDELAFIAIAYPKNKGNIFTKDAFIEFLEKE